MMTNKMKLKTTVESLDLDADDWGLFTASMNCDQVAKALNVAFMACVNVGMDRNQTRARMDAIREQFASFGAADSEPRYTLETLLDKVFGKQ